MSELESEIRADDRCTNKYTREAYRETKHKIIQLFKALEQKALDV